jgi:hypothetical protein
VNVWESGVGGNGKPGIGFALFALRGNGKASVFTLKTNRALDTRSVGFSSASLKSVKITSNYAGGVVLEAGANIRIWGKKV